MDLIKEQLGSQPEFLPLEIEEEILALGNPIQLSRASQDLNHNSTPAKNTHQQSCTWTITQDCVYHLMEMQSAPSAQQASGQKYPLQYFCDWAS
jgi:hypothetical protein